MNLGSLLRSAHAFGASFAFTIGAAFDARQTALADTSEAVGSLPFHPWRDLAAMDLPQGCRLVGVELLADVIELPSFTHPSRAAYVLGAERTSLSPALQERCDFVVRIPAKFCFNLAIAGALGDVRPDDQPGTIRRTAGPGRRSGGLRARPMSMANPSGSAGAGPRRPIKATKKPFSEIACCGSI